MSFNFMAAIIIFSDFGAPQNNVAATFKNLTVGCLPYTLAIMLLVIYPNQLKTLVRENHAKKYL